MPTTSHIVAPDKLVQIVRPFVGTGRSVHRGNSAIDVHHMMDTIDASVVAVDARGVEVARDGFATFVPWADVRSITVRGIADGITTAETVWRNAGAQYPAWDVPVRKAVAA